MRGMSEERTEPAYLAGERVPQLITKQIANLEN